MPGHSVVDAHEGFDGAVSSGHRAEEFGQAGQGAFAIDEVGCANGSGLDKSQRASDGLGRMMKTGEQGNVRIMQSISIELNRGAGGTSAEKVEYATPANELDGGFPGF